MKKLGLYLLLSLYIYALPVELNEIIRKSGLTKKDISIYIKQVGDGGKVIASLEAKKARTPASVIKVLTTYAAVSKLGFDYRWPTKIYTTGRLRHGVLDGDLLIKGFGDPTLDTGDIKEIAATIASKGINEIRGNIVIDRTYFRVSTKNSSGFDENTHSAYNAMPDAMMFNERVSTVCVTPNANDVHKKSPDGSYKVVNRLERVNKPCKGRYSWPGVRVDTKHATPQLILQGKISSHCGKRNICKVLTKPYKSFYYALKDALKNEGIKTRATMRLRKIPHHAKGLFTHYSKSLEKIISKTAKKSNNLYARHLLLLLGAKAYGSPATLHKGRKAVKNILQRSGALKENTLRLDNGSGLSRSAKLSAKLLADLYDHAYAKYGYRWMQTLSIAGVDGTIKKRFRGSIVKNRAWMKTGTLRHTKNIGGYVKSKQGILYTTVILVKTNKGLWKASALQNKIIKWLVGYKNTSLRAKHSKPTRPSRTVKRTVGDYYIQVGSFAAMPSDGYLSRIKAQGLSYSIENDGRYKVLIGGYRNENNARRVLSEIRKTVSQEAFLTRR